MYDLPNDASVIMQTLRAGGYTAYVVGGCVRDTLLNKAPKDWDICTSATPEEMQQVFRGFHVVETGLKHGTLTVVMNHTPYEVTTFRVDGAYTDHRHPDGVSFVRDVRDDLSRRDFTVNAMAYHPDEGLIDAFGGQEDLRRGIIRCVGDPMKRFEEDALRILRAMRFASVYDFTVDEATASAAFALKDTLTMVAAERIHAELVKLLCGKACGRILREFAEIIGVIIPEVVPMFGYDQHTPYHRYDVWEHTVRAVEAAEPTETLRVTMLLHDLGKPSTYTFDEQGIGHAMGHEKVSHAMAVGITDRLHFDRATQERILTLILHHDIPIAADERLMKRRLRQFGAEALDQLLSVQRSDAMGKGTDDENDIRREEADRRRVMADILAVDACFSLKQLAVNGRDLTAMGIRGKAVGEMLNSLLDAVIDGKADNTRESLLALAAELAE